MIKSKNILFFLLLLSVFGFSQNQEKSYEDEDMKCNYHEVEGRLNGKYVSYYKFVVLMRLEEACYFNS